MIAGFRVFDIDPDTLRWAEAALDAYRAGAGAERERADPLRHGQTWRVGVDALPNTADGSVNGIPLQGPWTDALTAPRGWHRAQVSVVLRGYPRQDPEETESQHAFRRYRHAAHVDGLLPEGAERRRFLREPHGFVLGLPLNHAEVAPLMVWPGSHELMGDAFRAAIGPRDPCEVDLTDVYQRARRDVFDRITPEAVPARPGQSVLLHRHLLHGVSPWPGTVPGPVEGRVVA